MQFEGNHFFQKNAKIAYKISRFCDSGPSKLRNNYKCQKLTAKRPPTGCLVSILPLESLQGLSMRTRKGLTQNFRKVRCVILSNTLQCWCGQSHRSMGWGRAQKVFVRFSFSKRFSAHIGSLQRILEFPSSIGFWGRARAPQSWAILG